MKTRLELKSLIKLSPLSVQITTDKPLWISNMKNGGIFESFKMKSGNKSSIFLICPQIFKQIKCFWLEQWFSTWGLRYHFRRCKIEGIFFHSVNKMCPVAVTNNNDSYAEDRN